MPDHRQRVADLAQQASSEQDPDKLTAIFQELNSLLEAEQKRVKGQRQSNVAPRDEI